MTRVRREVEKLRREKERRKKTTSTGNTSVTSPVNDTEMSTQMELAELREQCRKLQDDNDVSD